MLRLEERLVDPLRAVVNDLDFFERDEAAADHFIEESGEEDKIFYSLSMISMTMGRYGGKAEDFGGVEAAGFAETHGAAQHGS